MVLVVHVGHSGCGVGSDSCDGDDGFHGNIERKRVFFLKKFILKAL